MRHTIRAAVLATGLTALLAGCGGGASLTDVEGTVTGPDGKPMPDILVQFNPDQNTGSKVFGSSAVTDTNGRFALTCDNGKPGAVVGPHRVVLIDNAFGNEDDANLGKRPAKKQVNRVPQTYLSPTTTPLQIVVEAGKKSYELKVDRR